MKIGQLQELLGARALNPGEVHDQDIPFVAASDLMSDVLTFIKPGAVLISGLTNPQVIRTAEISEIAVVCFIEGKTPPRETLELASEKGVPLLCSPYSMFEACGILYAQGLRGMTE